MRNSIGGIMEFLGTLLKNVRWGELPNLHPLTQGDEPKRIALDFERFLHNGGERILSDFLWRYLHPNRDMEKMLKELEEGDVWVADTVRHLVRQFSSPGARSTDRGYYVAKVVPVEICFRYDSDGNSFAEQLFEHFRVLGFRRLSVGDALQARLLYPRQSGREVVKVYMTPLPIRDPRGQAVEGIINLSHSSVGLQLYASEITPVHATPDCYTPWLVKLAPAE